MAGCSVVPLHTYTRARIFAENLSAHIKKAPEVARQMYKMGLNPLDYTYFDASMKINQALEEKTRALTGELDNLSNFVGNILELSAKGRKGLDINTAIISIVQKTRDACRITGYNILDDGSVKFAGVLWAEKGYENHGERLSSFSDPKKPDGFMKIAIQKNIPIPVKNDENNPFPFVLIPIGRKTYKIEFKSPDGYLNEEQKDATMRRIAELALVMDQLGKQKRVEIFDSALEAINTAIQTKDEEGVLKIFRDSLANLGFGGGVIRRYSNGKIRDIEETRFGIMPQSQEKQEWSGPEDKYIEAKKATQKIADPISHIIVPLKMVKIGQSNKQNGDNLYGFMEVYKWYKNDRFLEEDIELIEKLGRRIGLALSQIQSEKRIQDNIGRLDHDGRKPIGTIIGFSSLLLGTLDPKDPTNEKILDYLNRIYLAAKAAELELQTVNYIVDDHPKTTIADFNMFLQDKITYISKVLNSELNKDCKINFISSAKFEPLITNPVELVNIFTELIRNSIKYGASNIVISTSIEKEKIQISIADNGFGIKEKDIDHVFEKDYMGDLPDEAPKDIDRSGNGLSIIKTKIEDIFLGEVELMSTWGKGTTITISFPAIKLEKHKPFLGK